MNRRQFFRLGLAPAAAVVASGATAQAIAAAKPLMTVTRETCFETAESRRSSTVTVRFEGPGRYTLEEIRKALLPPHGP